MTWIRSNDWDIESSGIKGKGIIQPTFWESQPNHVHALMRSTGGCIARCDSEDGGKTWSKVYCTDLPNNNSGIDLVKNIDGTLWLVYNPIRGNWGPRNNLMLAYSKDNGKTWTTQKGVAITYTWRRERIKFWHIPNDVLNKYIN